MVTGNRLSDSPQAFDLAQRTQFPSHSQDEATILFATDLSLLLPCRGELGNLAREAVRRQGSAAACGNPTRQQRSPAPRLLSSPVPIAIRAPEPFADGPRRPVQLPRRFG